MSAKRLPYMPFYVADWLSDLNVRAMSAEARGAYIDLLAMEWQDGPLPADPRVLRRMTGASASAVAEILPRFHPLGDGRMVNPKLERIRAEQVAAAEVRSARAKVASNARRRDTPMLPGMVAEAPPSIPADVSGTSPGPPGAISGLSPGHLSETEMSDIRRGEGGGAPPAPTRRKASGNPDVTACVGAFRRHVPAWPCRAKDAPHLVRLCKAQGQPRVLDWIERLWADVQADAFLAKLGYGVPALLNKATAYATADAGAATPVAFGALSPAGQALLDRSLGKGPAVPAIGRDR